MIDKIPPPTIVIDSSVALKWRLRDEKHVEQSEALIGDFVSGQLDIVVPALFDYEIANALKVALIRGRISEPECYASLHDFEALDFSRLGDPEQRRDALAIALRYGRSVYDATYLALAKSLAIKLYTGDLRLWNGVNSQLPWVCWIGDYDLSMV